MACCCKRKGDVRKCIPFYIVGGILCSLGLPLMIVGIVADFTGADLVGYVGGVSIFFGLGFFLLWHMFTIENIDKNLDLDYDPTVKDIRDVVEKSRMRESTSLSVISFQKQNKTGISNLAFEGDKNAYSAVALNDDVEITYSEASPTSENGDMNSTLNSTKNNNSGSAPIHDSDNSALDVSEANESGSATSFLSTSKVDIGSVSSSIRSKSSHNGTTSTTMMNEEIEVVAEGSKQKSLPVEVA